MFHTGKQVFWVRSFKPSGPYAELHVHTGRVVQSQHPCGQTAVWVEQPSKPGDVLPGYMIFLEPNELIFEDCATANAYAYGMASRFILSFNYTDVHVHPMAGTTRGQTVRFPESLYERVHKAPGKVAPVHPGSPAVSSGEPEDSREPGTR